MDLIKSDLKKLGIEHDKFFYESELVRNKVVDKAIEQLKKKISLLMVIYNLPKEKQTKIGKKLKD